MKQAFWAYRCTDVLQKNGFSAMKPHQFLRLQNEILSVVSFEGRKNDLYIWFSIYPLAMPDIWFSTGYGRSCGRRPIEEKSLAT